MSISKKNKYNTFLDKSYITPTGTIHWIASEVVNPFHVKLVYDISIICKRSLHINSGTHGNDKGETIFTHPFNKENHNYVNDIDRFI